ncbi:hypothetical protein TNCV_550401 [Trichonephila clavipes]|nr:hypothetical protein TNCV_550401 [Trichonephila clavipes]
MQACRSFGQDPFKSVEFCSKGSAVEDYLDSVQEDFSRDPFAFSFCRETQLTLRVEEHVSSFTDELELHTRNQDPREGEVWSCLMKSPFCGLLSPDRLEEIC